MVIGPKWRLGEGYDLLATYPASAVGAIWLVRSRADGTERAIKILRPELTDTAEVVDDFSALLDGVRRLDHPGILVPDETVADGNRVALVMRWLPGEDLRTLLNRQQLLTPASTVLMAADLCDALAAAHAVGIVHGDVKPSNVLLDQDPETGTPRTVMLTDFGMAALAARSGLAALPAEYQAPESGEIRQSRLASAADVYAVGVVLYEALAGRAPFTGAQPDEIAQLHREFSPLRIPALPDELWLLIAACLAKDPGQRPTAADSARLLREIAPTITALPALVSQDTMQIARIPVAPASTSTSFESGLPSVFAPIVLSQAVPAPVEPAADERPEAPYRSPLSGLRGVGLAVLSGAVVVSVALAFLHQPGNSVPTTFTVGSATEPAVTLGIPSSALPSTVMLSPTARASASPTPSPTAKTASAAPSRVPTSPSANGSTASSTAASASAEPSASTPSAVTVAWQCATSQGHFHSISKTACIGLGSDGALYVRGTFVASNGRAINDIRVSLVGFGQYLGTASESCDASSCSITAGPYDPSAGFYQAYAGIDGSSRDEVVSPIIGYAGG